MKRRHLLLAPIAAVLIVAGIEAGTGTDTYERKAMTNQNLVRRIYEEAFNGGRLDILDELVADAYEAPDGGRGAAAVRTNIADIRAGFPDIRFTIEDLIAEGDRVVVRWSWVATHRATFRGIAPTGKRITNSGIAIYQLRDGKIVRSWLETDRLGVMQQLGAAQAPAVGRP